MHSQRKKPTRAIPSTMIIIPVKNRIVAQLIPLDSSAASPAEYQKPGVKILCTLSVSTIADFINPPSPPTRPIPTPNTRSSVRRPQARVTYCFSIFSVMIMINITIKIVTARILATNIPHSSFNFPRLFYTSNREKVIIRISKK